ncbi:MAG: class I SAM-dependent methyltransferase [bacterium]|nr:class I SAM-dependent methyltransferase [bacterium]
MKFRVLKVLARQFRYRIQAILCPLLNLFRKRKHLPHVFFRFEGWFDFDDLYLKQIQCAKDGAVFVEVGTYLGKSLSFLIVESFNRNKNITIYAVDTWKGSEEHENQVSQCGGSLYDAFDKNMKQANLHRFFIPLQMTSEEASKRFDDSSVDFIFIDAAHDYANVKNDLSHWYPKLKPNRVIAGHDYTPTWNGVMKAVEEFFHQDFKISGVSWYHKKK